MFNFNINRFSYFKTRFWLRMFKPQENWLIHLLFSQAKDNKKCKMTHYIARINNKNILHSLMQKKILKYTFLSTVVKNAIVIFFYLVYTEFKNRWEKSNICWRLAAVGQSPSIWYLKTKSMRVMDTLNPVFYFTNILRLTETVK